MTAAPVEVAGIIAARLGLTGALGTTAEHIDGVYTGQLKGDLLHGPAKADAVRALAHEHGFDLAHCFAYSDSTDLPMLSSSATLRDQPRRRLLARRRTGLADSGLSERSTAVSGCLALERLARLPVQWRPGFAVKRALRDRRGFKGRPPCEPGRARISSAGSSHRAPLLLRQGRPHSRRIRVRPGPRRGRSGSRTGPSG